ncbi:unnamed protein product [Heligmosomoides polygyrus]|uniref:Uncharacterized protein n=1 Tax=Heligmosomoides polygyrus TaxID=6339 RepID=A0A183GR02_HELPZ|nr:unnamed protein product [Heligmosomoides polygyrus]
MFQKRDSHLVSFYSGNNKTQIDFILVKHSDRRLVTDAKVVPYEAVATQLCSLICTLKFALPRLRQIERCGLASIIKRETQLLLFVISCRRLPLLRRHGNLQPFRYYKLHLPNWARRTPGGV